MQLAEALPHLPPAVARVTQRELLAALPSPDTDTPEERADRAEAAIAAVIALLPYDALEARLAVRIVAADAHAMDCLRAAAEASKDPAAARQCRAQASAMMRQSQSALRMLRSDQAKRDKGFAERHPGVMERAGYWFKEIITPERPVPTEAEPVEDLDAEAEQYAVIYPRRATLIRRLRGLPEKCDFGPPRPALLERIVNGTGPKLRALDEQPEPAPA